MLPRHRLACLPLLFLLLMLISLAACQPAHQAPLKVGMNAWVGNDPLVLARDRGLIDPSRVKVVELASGTEVQRSLRNGLLDAAAVTLDEALRLKEVGMDLRVVAVLDVSAAAGQTAPGTRGSPAGTAPMAARSPMPHARRAA